MTKKVALLAVAALMLAGCNSGGGDSGGTDEPTTPTTITFMTSQGWIKDSEYDLAEAFEEQTGIHVEYQVVPADQYAALLTTKLNSGEVADIWMAQSDKFTIVTSLDVANNAVDLTSEEWVGRFDDTAQAQVSVDGRVYGLMIWDVSDSFSYIYNKTIFNELGLSVPTSFAEFKEVCAALLAAGVIPVYEPVADGWHHPLDFFNVSHAYNASDPNLVEELNNNETTLSEHPIFQQMIEEMGEVYNAGYWGEYAFSDEYSGLNQALADGRYAMAVMNMTAVQEILDLGGTYSSPSDFGVFPSPYVDNTVIADTPGGPARDIYSGSPNIDAAKAYLAFLAQPENLQYGIDQGYFNALPFSGLDFNVPSWMATAIEQYKPGTDTVYQNDVSYLNAQWMDIAADMSAYLLGDMDAATVIANIDRRRAEQAEAAGDPAW
jgi:raffinose/stachyose/melibiose transport system substrate-binding protein